LPETINGPPEDVNDPDPPLLKRSRIVFPGEETAASPDLARGCPGMRDAP
jgi:hypothetical protein